MERTTDRGRSSEAQRQTVQLDYVAAKPRIQDGDILLWSGSHLGSRFFRFLTKSRYSHAAIAARWGERLMVLQSGWVGVQAVPLSRTVYQYDGLVDWYRIKEQHRAELDLNALLAEARKNLGIRFGTMGVVRSTWNRILRGAGIIERWLGYSLIQSNRVPRAMFCSEYVARCFNKGGLKITDRPDNDTLPVDIATSEKFELQATLRNVAYRHAVKAGVLPDAPTGPIPQGL